MRELEYKAKNLRISEDILGPKCAQRVKESNGNRNQVLNFGQLFQKDILWYSYGGFWFNFNSISEFINLKNKPSKIQALKNSFLLKIESEFLQVKLSLDSHCLSFIEAAESLSSWQLDYIFDIIEAYANAIVDIQHNRNADMDYSNFITLQKKAVLSSQNLIKIESSYFHIIKDIDQSYQDDVYDLITHMELQNTFYILQLYDDSGYLKSNVEFHFQNVDNESNLIKVAFQTLINDLSIHRTTEPFSMEWAHFAMHYMIAQYAMDQFLEFNNDLNFEHLKWR